MARFRYFKVDITNYEDGYFIRDSYYGVEKGTCIAKVDLRRRFLSLLDNCPDCYYWDIIVSSDWTPRFRICKNVIKLIYSRLGICTDIKIIEELSEDTVYDILKHIGVRLELES